MKALTLKRMIITISCLTVISTLSNLFYASRQTLDEPIFLPASKQVIIGENVYYDDQLYLVYITEIDDSRRLNSVFLEGLENMQYVYGDFNTSSFNFNPSNANPYNDEVGRYYRLKRDMVRLTLSEEDIENINANGEMTIGKGMAFFSDGTQMAIDLGNIKITTIDHFQEYNLRQGGGGTYSHFDVDYATTIPIQIRAMDLSTFHDHANALSIHLILDDQDPIDLMTYDFSNRPIDVIGHFTLVIESNEEDENNQWRFNLLNMPIKIDRQGETFDLMCVYPFNGNLLDEQSVESYVKLWRSKHDQ